MMPDGLLKPNRSTNPVMVGRKHTAFAEFHDREVGAATNED